VSAIEQLEAQGLKDVSGLESQISKIPKKASHLPINKIVRYALENSMPTITIAEDDLQFTDKGAWVFFSFCSPAIKFGRIKSLLFWFVNKIWGNWKNSDNSLKHLPVLAFAIF